MTGVSCQSSAAGTKKRRRKEMFGSDLCSGMPSLISIAKPTNYTFSLLFGFVSIDMLASCLNVSLNG